MATKVNIYAQTMRTYKVVLPCLHTTPLQQALFLAWFHHYTYSKTSLNRPTMGPT